ncbi:RNA-directed DNA polymerase, eukaryota [Tanacetum coccineum]
MVVQDTSSSAQHDAMIMFLIEEMTNQVAKCIEVDKENKTINESLTTELERHKEQIKLFEERQKFDLNDRENYTDSQFNYEVTCKDKAKRRNSGTKTKTCEDNCYLLPYVISSKEYTAYQCQLITRILCMTQSTTKELLTAFENPERVLRSRRKLFDTPIFVESNSSKFDRLSEIEEHIEEEVSEIMTKTMEQYMSTTHGEYGSGIARPKIDAKAQFELKGKLSCFTMGSMFQQGISLTQEVSSQPKQLQMLKWSSKKWPNTLKNGTMDHLQKAGVLKLLTGWLLSKPNLTVSEEKLKRAAGPGFYQRNNGNSSYPAQRETMEESLSKFMTESAKRHEENSNIIKEIRASTDAAIRNQGASIKTLELQIRQMSKVLQERGESVSVMPFSTYINLDIGVLSHTRLTIELADRTIKQPRGIAESVLVRIGKFVFPTDFIILDIPEDDDVPLILGRPFLSTTHVKIDVFNKKVTLRSLSSQTLHTAYRTPQDTAYDLAENGIDLMDVREVDRYRNANLELPDLGCRKKYHLNLGLTASLSSNYQLVCVNRPHLNLANLLQEMDDPYITTEEYVQLETERALRNNKVYNWETATYAIVYNDALTSKLDFSSKPTVSPQHVDELNWKNETSLSEYDDEEYNVISCNDLFPFNIIFVNELKLGMNNDDDKIDIKQSSRDISIKPLHNVINIDVVTIKPVPVSQAENPPLSLELVLCSARPLNTPYPPVGYDISNLLLRQRIDCCSLNNVSVLSNNTVYSENSIRFTTWEDLVEKFVQKFYQLSDDNEEMEADEGDDLDDIVEIFKIEGILFENETPLCKAFNDFNYLLKIDTNLFTFDIQGIKTYEGYELNNNMAGDSENKALMHKAKVEGSWVDPTPGVMKFRAWNYGADNASNIKDNQEHKKEHHDPSTCLVRRFEMIKYSFNADDEYVAIKEHECSDHSKTNIDACQAYRELFRIMDEGWLMTKACDE